jgi:hypothetical protein
MRTFQLLIVCFIFNLPWCYAGPKRFYSSPFLPGIWNPAVVREYYSLNDEVGGPSDYFYDDKGLLYKKVFIRSDGYRSTTSFEYNPDGHLKTSERILSDGHTMLFTYTYDDSDHLTNRMSLLSDSVFSNESYLFNASGRLEKAFYVNVDGWLTGKLEFGYSMGNLLTSGIFKGQDGLHAEIHFTYNPEGLLEEIRWIFSNGKFQVYSFLYGPD